MRWQEYPEYKPSREEWFREIPKHWKLKPLKRIFKILSGSTPRSSEAAYWEGDIPWATPDDLGSLEGDTIQVTQRTITQEGYESCGTSLAPTGSLVLSTRAPIGHLALAGVPLCTNQGCRCLVFLAEDNRRFYYYKLLAVRQELESWGQGSTFRELSRDKLGTILLCSPPLDEQHAIAAFLARETERIDNLIAKKERQVELLQEKRAALISQVVTKDLNPDAKMKDSGIEWLGEIPEHWTVCLLKRAADMAYGMSGELDRTLTEGMRILSLPNVNIDGELVLDEVPFANVPVEQRSELSLKRGDLLFNWRNGSSDHLGKTAYFNLQGEYTHVSFLIRLRFNPERHDSRYFQRLLNGLRITGFFSSSKAGVNNTFNQSELANLWVMVPPLEEQRSIADYLDRETGRIRELAVTIQQSIDRLFEYRIALISAAVTGKIDVRQEAD